MMKWGRKSSKETDDETTKTKNLRSPRRGRATSEDGFRSDDGSVSEPKKSKKIKKMRMRLRKKKKKLADGSVADDSSYASSVSGRPDPRGKGRYGTAVAGNGTSIHSLPNTVGAGYGYGADGGFQLDNIPVGRLPPQVAKAPRATDEDKKKFRVKPHHAFPAAVYMNESELYQCMQQPSESVEFLTSFLNPSTKLTRRVKVSEVVRRTWGTPKDDSRIGSLKVEVLGCVGLARAKPEVSVYLVVGDCAFSTDIIHGARSPMWPNACKRACVFPLHHAYARLFVGVFDVRQRKSSEADHFCGRIAIDIAPLRPNTEYDATFPLRNSSFIYDRRARGVIRLRFSLHWFSERAAIMSYMKRPRNPLAFSKQAKKQPTIPCGDPKSFRNVAVTVHGVDFPGKYTRAAFRATMREFNLYQQNLRFLFKVMILDCILYENPLMSLYLFSASMHCVWLNSVRLVPPYFVGWLIYMFVENYLTYNATLAGHLGYKPLTIMEMAYGLARDSKDKKANFQPLIARKRVRKHQSVGKDENDIELINHREFPFSERFAYPKFAAALALAPSPAAKNKKGEKGGADLRTARRLSIYVAPVEEKEESDSSDSEGESEQGDKDDDASMMDQGDDGYGDIDSEDEVEEEEMEGQTKAGLFESGKASVTRRIRVGPPQNSETSGRKVPPQVHLSRVEHLLHRASKNISVEMVHFPPAHVQAQLGKELNSKAPAGDVMTAKEKQTFDEFDRLLGFRTKNPNPILRITSSFLGPLMRIIRIFIYATRISFNLTTWRDPYLSFWVLVFLSTLAFVLFIFPWRTFFFTSTMILLGPQNIAVRKYLERRTREKEQDERERAEAEKRKAATAQYVNPSLHETQAAAPSMEDATEKAKKKNRWGFGRTSKTEETTTEEEQQEASDYVSPRPAFYGYNKPTRRTQIPRDVAVPYFRFRKDRFYDWPPDPLVSRATPMLQSSASAYGEDISGSSHHRREHDLDGGYTQGTKQKRKKSLL